MLTVLLKALAATDPPYEGWGHGTRRVKPISISLLALSLVGATAYSAVAGAAHPGRSTNIAATANGLKLINLNHDSDSATVFLIDPAGSGQAALTKAAEITVGDEPHCVAIHPSNAKAYVTTADGFVSVIALEGTDRYTVTKKIRVGTEPRGCALTPSGGILYVANHTDNTVSLISTASDSVFRTSDPDFIRPYAIAVTDDGDGVDAGEIVFVTDFFAQSIPGGPGRPFDTGSRGIVRAFRVGDPTFFQRVILPPLANAGFPADRTAFCAPTAHSQVYCPSSNVTADPQGAFPNQLHAAVIRGNRLFLPSIGAAPEPPVKFNVNVQALVHVVNTNTLAELPQGRVNLNTQIATETQPATPTASLGRLFGNDIVAIDANAAGTEFVLVSRGGDYVLKARLVSGALSIGAPNNVVRLQTGHIPTGIVISGTRAYTNNEVGRSVSVLDFAANTVVARNIESTSLPSLGSFDHNVLMGKLAFFTALGVPDNGLSHLKVRDINTLKFRGKQSDNGWSSCGSCHPAGLSDGVTWIFPAGPRQTIPLDGTYSKRAAAHDTRILNWSAVRGNNTDFNANSIAVQGGVGFAGTPPNPNVFDHGITQGGSEALDDQTLWVQTVRPLAQKQPNRPAAVGAGRTLFNAHCASCHGSAKWTKSQIFYRNNPTLAAPGGAPLDAGLTVLAGGQIQSYTSNGKTLTYLETVGTFDPENQLEIRSNGLIAAGAAGFNVPSLLDVRYHAPYLHDGSAANLKEVFEKHKLSGGATIENTLTAIQRTQLVDFLETLDATTTPLRSQADEFRDPAN